MKLQPLNVLLDGKLDGPLDPISVIRHFHPSLPLVGLKYHKTESPKFHPIVRQCRGTVLELPTFRIVARPFNRFFNLHKDVDGQEGFTWNHFTAETKEDGTLIIAFNYEGRWLIKTGGSWALGNITANAPTWQQAFFDILPVANFSVLDPAYTYMFELCTPYNKVVVKYDQPKVFLLGAINTSSGWELDHSVLDYIASRLGCARPTVFSCSGNSDLKRLVDSLSKGDVKEGFVLRDIACRRIKVKTAEYQALHHLKDNGNILLPRRLAALVLSSREKETLAVFPEMAGALSKVSADLYNAMADVENLWWAHRQLSRKDFAIEIKDTPFTWVLFGLYTNPPSDVRSTIYAAFANNVEKVAQKLWGGQVFQFDCAAADE
jgi:hypothetical protein